MYNPDSLTLLDSFYTDLDDLEGLTFCESDSLLYLAQEYPPTIHEFDLLEKSLTGKSWELPGFDASEKQGMEGLTYFDGYFYAANQKTGSVLVYSIVDNSSSSSSSFSSSAVFVHEFDVGWNEDASGITFDAETGLIIVVSDRNNEVVAFRPDWSIDKPKIEWRKSLPNDGQEGVAYRFVDDRAQVFIANDDGKKSTIHRCQLDMM